MTKYRDPVLTASGLSVIEKAFREVARKMDFSIVEVNGEADHVHALIEYPPKLSVSQMVNALKGVSSRLYGKAGLPKPGKSALWSPVYFATACGGEPIDTLMEYIKNQKKPS